MYNELMNYKAQYDNCDVPANWKENKKLANWVTRQRTLYRKGKLSQERIAKLKNIGFTFLTRANGPFEMSSQWLKIYEELISYRQEHGHCYVPQNFKGNQRLHLGAWCDNQRRLYKSGGLSPEKIKLLQEIEFNWTPKEDKWYEHYNILKDYIKKYGHSRISKTDKSLYQWINHQRTQYKNGKLKPERIELLDAVGFIWDELEYLWQEGYAQLVAFKEKYGHCNAVVGKSKLGRWVGKQRQKFRSGQLSPERIGLLNDLGFDWNPPVRGAAALKKKS
jgi:hypothetical protein